MVSKDDVSYAHQFFLNYFFQILIHADGIRSEVSISGSANHFCGAMTIFSLLLLSQAPHQLKLLLATTECLHEAINFSSSVKLNFSGSLTNTCCSSILKFFFTHSASSEKIKKTGSFTLLRMISTAFL